MGKFSSFYDFSKKYWKQEHIFRGQIQISYIYTIFEKRDSKSIWMLDREFEYVINRFIT